MQLLKEYFEGKVLSVHRYRCQLFCFPNIHGSNCFKCSHIPMLIVFLCIWIPHVYVVG